MSSKPIIGSAHSRGHAASRTPRRLSDLDPNAWIETPTRRAEDAFNFVVNVFMAAMMVAAVCGIGLMVIVAMSR